ncbi:uncharacterized protein LOC62_02G002133 [Vanrija pseudolonga]|uniref:Uncharacterized protein n=1 Tax=Vanrija pseudolonga TaxID=143232 RepID=A0AAF0Y386_9TREE|nr:hypothetical protein LOC62_02G002133 [Vanrija pseudolonga]
MRVCIHLGLQEALWTDTASKESVFGALWLLPSKVASSKRRRSSRFSLHHHHHIPSLRLTLARVTVSVAVSSRLTFLATLDSHSFFFEIQTLPRTLQSPNPYSNGECPASAHHTILRHYATQRSTTSSS